MVDNRSLKHRAANGAMLALERVGLHVLPTHFYSPVANRRALRDTEASWRRPLDPVPFPWSVDDQAKWLKENAGTFPSEILLTQVFTESARVGAFRYGPIEAQFLYSWIRTNAPDRIVEIGSGSSTVMMSLASRRNADEGREASRIVAIDPYQADNVRGLPHVDARAVGAEEVTADILELGAGDLLFIDSTHAVRTGSELAHLYLELAPRLAPGVIVHIHDIYLPYLYGPDLFQSVFDWQETTLVAALLAGNPHLEVLAAMSALCHDRPDTLRQVFPEYRPSRIVGGLYAGDDDGHFPSSLWLRSTGRPG